MLILGVEFFVMFMVQVQIGRGRARAYGYQPATMRTHQRHLEHVAQAEANHQVYIYSNFHFVHCWYRFCCLHSVLMHSGSVYL